MVTSTRVFICVLEVVVRTGRVTVVLRRGGFIVVGATVGFAVVRTTNCDVLCVVCTGGRFGAVVVVTLTGFGLFVVMMGVVSPLSLPLLPLAP